MNALRDEQCTFFMTSRSVLLRTRDVSSKVVEKITSHVFLFNYFLSKTLPFMS